ncbi:MAG TPA: AEC family transporter [Candidatus Stercoripulliclostridium merdigallinarum]|uniref:AEC family transporter n=1 Tax=Candidatus Stercoripulliclostridium merdigallinarum TaxID=2840951 RepID=A0A9D1MI48_9FIRM|nr:AEC family transporter [Candidatus Stercoripulliclostridium merdigallinarum]
MGDLFLTGAISVGMLLLMAVPGFILGKMRSVNTESAVKFLSVMLLYILQPFVTFDSFLNTAYDPEVLINIVIVFVFTCVTIGAVLAVGSFAMRFTKFGKDVGGVIAYGGAFGNVGYMCIPFLQLMAPGDYVIILYATVSVVAFNLMAWTVGNFALTGDKRHISLKRALLNPPTLSFILALPLFLLNLNFIKAEGLTGAALKVVSGIQEVIGLFSDMVGPLAMVLLGLKLADIRFGELFADGRVYIATGIKLIFFPLFGVALTALMSLFMNVESISLNLIAMSAMPCAQNVIMFSTLYDKDSALAAKEVTVSTLLSIVTIPVMLLFLSVL